MSRAEGAKRGRARAVLRRLRLALAILAILAALAVTGIVLVRAALLRSAYDAGTAMAHSYAAEQSGNLAVYRTLLAFGTSTADWLTDSGEEANLSAWMTPYFERLDLVLGSGVVDPYVVTETGEIVAAHPWEGDADYDVESTPWYRKAMAAGGPVIFTDLYEDAITGQPVITAAQKCRRSNMVVAFDILPEHFEFDTAELEEGSSFYLCDSRGTIIYQKTELPLSHAEIQGYISGIMARIADGTLGGPSDSVVDLDGHRRGVYYARMDNGWYSIVTMPYSSILDELRGFVAALVLFILAALLPMAVLTWQELRLNARVERAQETVRVLGNTYYALYRVNYAKETYEMIKGSEYVASRIPPAGAYTDLLHTAGEVIEANAFREFTESFSCDNIRSLVCRRVRDFGGEFLRRFGEEYRWVSVRVLFDESLAPEEVVLCFKEVEQEKQRQLRERRLLEDSLELAQKNEASKQAFFRNMSHDMRTPLNAILGLSELAAQHPEDAPRLAGYLKKIRSSSRYLLDLINDILDMARMEQGAISLDLHSFDLRQCAEDCLETFRLPAEQGGKTLKGDFRIGHARLLGDSLRIQQILNNLLSNALKFTPAGGTISLSVEELARGEHGKYKFVVADTGIGMSAEFLQRIFEPYAREMRFSDRQAAGTGLGMSITKSLVSQMDGEIQVESTPGQGSVFTVVLPLAAAEDERAPEEARGRGGDFSLQGLHILLAEDNEINMEITTELLSSQGVLVTQAWNGKEAAARFQEAAPFAFDAVLMDMQMPVMDGCEAARRIRALDRPDAQTVPIVAVTANAFAEDIAATAAAGMNGHISKPIDFGALRQTLERLLQKP